jgi:hypothetical protein
MDAKKKTATTGSKTGSAKPAVAKGVKKKKAKKSTGDGEGTKPVKKAVVKKEKKEEFKVMSLEEIEELFEKKSQIFHNKMLEYQQEKL